jgi:hypothetical protein
LLIDDSEALRTATHELAVAVARPEVSREFIAAARGQKKQLEVFLEKVYGPLKPGLNDEEALQRKLAALPQAWDQCGLSQELLIFALSTLSKVPSARSTADAEVLAGLEGRVSRALAAATATASGSGGPACARKVAAVGRALAPSDAALQLREVEAFASERQRPGGAHAGRAS